MSKEQSVKIPYIIKPDGSVTLYIDDECITVSTFHLNYIKIMNLIKVGDFDNIKPLIYCQTKLNSEHVVVENGQVIYDGRILHSTEADHIIKMMQDGYNVDYMIKFLENLLLNPSYPLPVDTFVFLESWGLPITDDGCFLAYKAVNSDYKDIFTGTIDNIVNSVGTTVAFAHVPCIAHSESGTINSGVGTIIAPYTSVDDSRQPRMVVGSLQYLIDYGYFSKKNSFTIKNKLLIVKVNPEDIIDFIGGTSVQVSKYYVLSEISDIAKELGNAVSYKKLSDPWDIQEDWDPFRNYWMTGNYSKDANNPCDYDDNYNEHISPMYDRGYKRGIQDKHDGCTYQLTNEYNMGYSDGYYNQTNFGSINK